MDNKASGARQKAARTAEYIIQGIFLILGLITVGCVLVITVYLIIAGIPGYQRNRSCGFSSGQKMGINR